MVWFYKRSKGNKSFWQITLAVLMLLMTIFFVKNEQLELAQITDTLKQIDSFYVLLGILVTGIYIFFQGLLYVYSFKTVGIHVKTADAIQLFLKRNLISIFLPAGGFSSLAFFNKSLTKKGIETTDIYYGSTIYGFVSLLSVIIVAIPVFVILLMKSRLTTTELFPFLALLVLIIFLIFFIWSFLRQKYFYHLIIRLNPKISLVLDKISSTQVQKVHFFETLLISVFIELTGISHVYISMLALGFSPTILLSFIAYIVMVMLLIVSPFLRGMGAIEVSMTYVFVKSGIPAAQAAAITLVSRFFEFWTPLITGLGAFFFTRKNILLRVLPVFIIFISGLINIFSVITPALPGRIEILEKLLPEIAVLVSNFTVFFTGLLFLILAYYLLKGVRRAWRITVILLFLSTIGHLVKGIDYEEASVSLVALMSLFYTRRLYHVKSSPLLRANFWKVWVVSFSALAVYAVGGTYFIEKSHMGLDYNLIESLKASFQLVFLFDASQYLPQTLFGHYYILSVHIMSGGLLISAIFLALRPIFDFDVQRDESEFSRAKLLVQNFGKSALDYFKYYPDKLFWFNEQGFVAYKIHHHFAVVLELPVCETDEAAQNLLQAFENYANDAGMRTFYYRVPEYSIPWFHHLNKKAIFIGQEAILDLSKFSLSGSKMHPIRNAINKAKNLGFTFHIYLPPAKDGLLQKLKQVSDDWLSKPGKSETVFSQGMFLPEEMKKSTILTIENPEEKVVAFLNIIPDYVSNEGTYDLVRITEDAPTGIIYFLFIEMFEYFRKAGISKVNLGMVAFAGITDPKNITERSMKFALDNLKALNHFKGQFSFKDKFNPDWVKKFLIYDSEYDLINFPAVLKGVSKP
jgi:phosphatidylglycerol lysyltransferase